MIDPITAAAVVAFLSPFLMKAGEKVAEKAADALTNKVGELYGAVKEKLSTDQYGGLTLLRLEESPDDEGRRSALQHVIQENMLADDSFAGLLTKLVEEAKQLQTQTTSATGERSIAISGDVTSSSISTGDIKINLK